MGTKQKHFQKIGIYDNREEFQFEFEGIEIDFNIDYNKINTLIENFVNNPNHKNMVRNVAFLRTIFKDFEEGMLKLSYGNGKDEYESISYYNGILISYESCQNNKLTMRASYEEKSGLNIHFNNSDKEDIISCSNTEETKEMFDKFMENLHSLFNVKTVTLDDSAKTIIEIYTLFYNENPNFSEKNINIKVQTMMSILAQFGIGLSNEDIDFTIYAKGKLPMSLRLQQIVEELYPLGEINEVDEPVKLRDWAINTIKVVGKYVRDLLKNEYKEFEEEDVLSLLSRVIHAGGYSLYEQNKVDKISKYAHCAPKEVETTIQLVKKINKELDSKN